MYQIKVIEEWIKKQRLDEITKTKYHYGRFRPYHINYDTNLQWAKHIHYREILNQHQLKIQDTIIYYFQEKCTLNVKTKLTEKSVL